MDFYKMQHLQEYLVTKFQQWKPKAPEVMERTKSSVTLKWLEEEPFGFMRKYLMYKIQRKEKIPPWVTVYSGGKTIITLENLAPSHPHKFRLQVILKSTAVSLLPEVAVCHYGDVNIVKDNIKNIGENYNETTLGVAENKSNKRLQEALEIPNEELDTSSKLQEISEKLISGNENSYEHIRKQTNNTTMTKKHTITSDNNEGRSNSTHMWVESQWSEETWTSTDTAGTSAMCFCMAVRCGYFKQIQIMLEERPILIGAINSISGLSPLATAVKKGDLNTVKFVLSLGAEVDQPTTASQTPLHLAVLSGHTTIADVLLEKGANFQAQDFNGLRVEHFAVDSCNLEMVKYIMDKGGNVGVKDSNGWTPLFRAVCQGAKTAVIEELMYRGSSVDVTDCRGLTLVAAARLLRNRQGRSRDSVLRLVDAQFPHEKAVANFTRLTKKIYSVHTLLK